MQTTPPTLNPRDHWLLGAGTIYSYERISSHRQQSGRGLERQGTKAEEWCAQRGLQLDRSLDLSDSARSAYHGENLEADASLARFMALAEAGTLGKHPVLLVESLDRLTRIRPRLALEKVALRLINSCGVHVVSLFSGRHWSADSVDQAGASALIEMTVEADNAYLHSRKLAERITSSWDQAYADLEAGRLPRGDVFLPRWCCRDADGSVQLIPGKAEIVRQIFAMAREFGSKVIAQELNRQQIPRLSGSGSWSRDAVDRILHDPRVFGAVQKNDPRTLSQKRADKRGERSRDHVVFRDVLPLVLAEEEAQEVLACVRARSHPKTRRGNRQEVLCISQSITYCSCGAKAGSTSTHTKKDGKRVGLLRYMKCSHRRDHADGCRGLSYRLEQLNLHLLNRLNSGQLQQLLSADTDKAKQVKRETNAVTRLQAQVHQAQEKQSNAEKLFKAALLEGRDDPLYREAVEESRQVVSDATAALAQARQRLSALRHEVDTDEFTTALRQLYDAFLKEEDTPELRGKLNQFLVRSGIRVILDNETRRVGMAIGDGPVDWQPLHARARRLAIEHGVVDATTEENSDLIAAVNWTDDQPAVIRYAEGRDPAELMPPGEDPSW